MCPYFYSAYTGKKHETPLPLCRANNMDTITDYNVENVCKNNCMSCYIYRRESGGKPPERIPQYNNNAKSSGGCGTVFVVLGIIIIVTKCLGLW